jgi:hypothetical protein
MILDLIATAGAIGGLLLLGRLYLDARRDHCRECVQPFGIFGDGRCFACWRRRWIRSRR